MMETDTNNQPAIIRLYQPGDLEAARALWVELTEWHRRIYGSSNIGGLNPGLHFEEHLRRVGPEHIWIAEMEGQVIGLAGLILNADEAELEPLVVSEVYCGSGIGKQLADVVIAAAIKQGAHQLVVRPVARNTSAIHFFHELGFEVLGQVEMFMDFSPKDRQIWILGEQLAGKPFRI